MGIWCEDLKESEVGSRGTSEKLHIPYCHGGLNYNLENLTGASRLSETWTDIRMRDRSPCRIKQLFYNLDARGKTCESTWGCCEARVFDVRARRMESRWKKNTHSRAASLFVGFGSFTWVHLNDKWRNFLYLSAGGPVELGFMELYIKWRCLASRRALRKSVRVS
jgi:hypothetical protein